MYSISVNLKICKSFRGALAAAFVCIVLLLLLPVAIRAAELPTLVSSTIDSPLTGFSSNAAYVRISGTATGSADDPVSKVEVTADGGATWITATGITSWAKSISFPVEGVFVIKSRATSQAGVVEAPKPGISVVIDRVAPTGNIMSAVLNDLNSVTLTLNTRANTPGMGCLDYMPQACGYQDISLSYDTINWTPWVQAEAIKRYDISMVVQKPTIYAKLRDSAGNVSAILSAPLNICGSASNSSFAVMPSANLCTIGTSSAVTGIGPWFWSCSGSIGGPISSCSAAQAGGIVYRSTNSGITWTPSKNGTGLNSNAGPLLVSPTFSTDRTLFLGADGIYKSTDKGDTWNKVQSGYMTNALVASPNYASDKTFFAGMYTTGVYKSSDGGSTWAASNSGLSSIMVTSLAISPAYANDHIIFAGIYAAGVFKSIDSGATWAVSNTGMGSVSPLSLATSPAFASDNTIFAVTTNGQYGNGGPNYHLYVSVDGGSSWSLSDSGITGYLSEVKVSPNFAADQTLFVTTSTGIFKSIDRGASWTLQSTGNYSALALSPSFANDQTLFAGIYGANTFISTNGGSTWSPSNSDFLTKYQLASMEVSPFYASDHTLFTVVSLAAPMMNVSPSSLSFASVAPNSSSASKNITIINGIPGLIGSGNLALTGIVISGTNAGDFSLTSGTCSSLNPTITSGSQCSVNVTFNPKSTGLKSAYITLTPYGAFNTPYTITLNGTGVVLSSSITSPSAGFITNSSEITVAGTAAITSGDTIGKVEVSLDGGTTWQTATGTTSWSINIPVSLDGSYNLKSRATSNGGVVESPSAGISVTVDRTPPVVSLTSTPMNFSNQASGSFSFTASEQAVFECSIDSGALVSCSSPYSYADIAKGGHVFSVRAIDGAGNTATKNFSWTVNTALPVSSEILLPQTGQMKCYDASGAETLCDGTGQDGDIRAGVPWSIDRFTDNTDGTINDLLTGLTWSRDGNVMAGRNPEFDADGTAGDGAVTWQHALDYVKKLNQESYSGFNDWRLPNSNELLSLIDASQMFPALPLGHPFQNVQGNMYWSSNTSPYSGDSYVIAKAAYVGGFGVLYGFNKRNWHSYVWPVRSTSGGHSSKVLKTGQTVCYDSGAAEPGTQAEEVLCTGTGQDGEYQAGINWQLSRFTDSGNITVTDNVTGLTWPKDANLMASQYALFDVDGVAGDGQVTLQHAHDFVAVLNSENYLGFGDWRLPNINELASLVDLSRADPSLPANHPFANVSAIYWSSSTSPWSTATSSYQYGDNWVLGLQSAGLRSTASKESFYAVLPVRGGYVQQKLTVARAGTGNGAVTIDAGSLSWNGNTGITRVNPGDLVTLTAAPEAGTTFTGWTGDCSGTDTCQLTMDAARNVTATFTLIPVNGACGSDNGQTLVQVAPTALCSSGVASAVTGSGHPWTWACQGDIGTEPASCSAAIQMFTLSVAVSGTGRGDVQSDVASNDVAPAVIFCPNGSCSANYDFGRTVRLTASPDPVSLFATWEGDCAPSNPCDISLTSDKAVIALFSRDYYFKNARSGSPDNSFDTAIADANNQDEIRMLATDVQVNTVTLNKALSISGGWRALHVSRADSPTSLVGTLAIKDADSSLSNTVIKGVLVIQSGSLKVSGVTVSQ